ncbi:MAG: hypothetical protein ING32_15730 [Curvibacter sp.]|jgi:hypothetical protein|nr:hypothetical protein [Curvibacter sp.]
MTLLDIFWHLLNFAAPALGLALLLPVLGRPFYKARDRLLPWWGQMLVNFLVGLAVLSAALWWFGRDGKMMGYALLVVAVASSQWLLVRGWRR